MDSKDFRTLNDAYRLVYEAKAESPEKEEEDMKKDDDLFGSPNKKKNGKKADKDYDGDGKVESSKDEYFGSKDKAIKKAMGKDVKEARWWDVDINEAVYGGKKEAPKDTRMVVTAADKKANTPAYQKYKAGSKLYKAADHMKEGYGKKKKKHDCASKVKHEQYGVGNCIAEMHDLDENGNVAHYDVLFEHGVEKNVPVETLQILEGHMHEHYIAEKQKDTPDQVKAVIAYDRARKGTDDATYDSLHGDKKQAKKERDYAKWQRDKGAEDAQKSGHRWKHAKGSTREKEGKKSETHAYIKDSFAVEGYGKKKKHDCASKVKHEEFGIGNCIKGMHTIDENNMVTHYDVEFKKYIVENCPVEELEILVSEMHMHKAMKEGVVSKEVKALSKAGKTLKGKDVAKADKIDMPTSKGYKFGVKEAKDWIQGAVKRPGAFTRKAKAAGQSVQAFAKTVDDNPGKYSTRTKRQANLAQTFASMKKEDVEEMIFNYIAESHENA